jgi:type VI secretion system secreted protein Hcp
MGVPLGASAPTGGVGDMFLLVKGERYGLIKGESQDEKHKGEIDVLSWSWGMESAPAIGGGMQKKASVRDLRVVKRVDSASTALMNALRHNELIVTAVLTLEFLKVTIENGRVTEVTVDADRDGPQLLEKVRFSFNKITVEYIPQGKDGQALGGMTYNDQFGEVG